MTNHTPTFTSSSASASFSENANTTDSTTPHLLSGTLNFKDSDHSDTHTTSAALRTAVWSGGPAIPATVLADLASDMSSSILTDSNGSGSLKWSFSAPDDDFDFLAKDQTLVLTYDITVTDNHGASAKQTVKVTITGTDDKPVINMEALATVTEQDNTTLSFAPDTTHVALQFVDPDLSNVGYTASVIAASADGTTSGLLPGFLGTAELMSFFHVDNVVKAAGSSNGTINTTFSAPDLAFDYLAAGETVDITYKVQLDDHAGGISTQDVVVTVIGSNDKPVFLSGPESAHLTEDQNVSPAGNLTAHGDLFFTDVDLSDTHTVSTSVLATRSGGGSIPLSDADLLAALTTPLEDSTGHLLGEVDWNFALANSAVNFLQGGETLTLTYDITVTDPAGDSDTQVVTVTVLGTNHPVMITSGPESASLSEQADTTGSPALDTTSPVPTGTISFTDQDTSYTHTVAVAVASADWSGGPSIPAATQADLTTALATTLNDSTGSGSGGVDWTFSIPDNALDFLAAGETLAVTYTLTVSDASTSAAQTVTVTAVGENDAVAMTSGPESASLSEQPNMTGSSVLDTTSPVPTGTLSFADVDLSDTHQVSVLLDSAVWSGGPEIPGQTQSDLQFALATALNDSTGTGSGGIDWTFSIQDQDLDFLHAGDTLTVTYDVAVADALTSSTQTVTVTINGAADTLVVHPLTADMNDAPFTDAGNIVAAGNVITDAFDSPGDGVGPLSVTEVNGSGANVGSVIAGAFGSLIIFSSGFYQYEANANLDALQVGDTSTDSFTFTVTNGTDSQSTTLTFNVNGADDSPVITAADTVGSMTEDAGPTVLVNGGFETGDLTGWTTTSASISAQVLALGGEFGNYAAKLAPNAGQTLAQDVTTTPGQHYTLSFYVTGDPESTNNSMAVSWDGATILSLNDVQSAAFTKYTFDVVGDATLSTTPLHFTYSDDGTAMFVDQVSVDPVTGPPTESADGTISFSDAEAGDTHVASFTPQGGDYVGTFSLDPVTEVPGSGSVGWHFTVDNSDIQFLSQGQSLNQTYGVLVTDSHGASTQQNVTVTINGTNDAPTANADTIVTDVDTNNAVSIPGWTLVRNDSDPDTADTLSITNVDGGSGGIPLQLGDTAGFIDDGTLGGSFTYQATDGIAVSAAATATVVNNSASTTTLTGTGGDDILIGSNGSEALDGGAGNDILIGNSGSHVLTGGAGNDVFAFEQTTDGPNTITDFNNTTEMDLIAVSAAGFGSGLTPGMDVSPLFETTGDDQFQGFGAIFHFDTANETLYFSSDGTTASAIALVQFQPGVVLHANDLLIV